VEHLLVVRIAALDTVEKGELLSRLHVAFMPGRDGLATLVASLERVNLGALRATPRGASGTGTSPWTNTKTSGSTPAASTAGRSTTMDERARRVGRNEALFRTINEELEKLERASALEQGDLTIVCECGDLLCDERFVVSMSAYEDVRADSSLFFVLPGHEKPDVEDVVARDDGYYIVRKHPGGPARLAEATDPRS
jgi:hypothetical protein